MKTITDEDKVAVLKWLFGNDTGVSSENIAGVALGVKEIEKATWGPMDPADFGRCARLIALAPSVREAAFPALAAEHTQWARLIARWDEIHATMEEEVGIDWSKGDAAPRTYELMRQIIEREAA